jgi:hypothetical protein
VPGQTLTTEAFVIEKRPPTDAFQAFGLFSAEHGNLLALQRIPRKASSTHVAPDLFDEVSAMLESSNQGRTWFMKEVRIDTRGRTQIGRSYDALRFASALVSGHQPQPRARGEPRKRRGAPAHGARRIRHIGAARHRHLKSLYLFARDEGYPVKQEWLPSLSARPPGSRGNS